MNTTVDTQLSAAFSALINGEIAVWDDAENALKQAGCITMNRYIPLMHLVQGPLRLQELAHVCRIKESAASRLIERMCRDGLVEKACDPNDRRGIVLKAAPAGEEAAAAARPIFDAQLAASLSVFSPEELDTLTALLEKLIPKD